MRLLKYFLIFVVAPAFCFQAATQEISANGDLSRIIARKKIVAVFTRQDQPPFYFVDKDDGFCGYDVDLAHKIAEELGVELVITREAASFNELVEIVASGKADMAVSKLSRTLSRAKGVKFTMPYANFMQGLLFNRLQLAKVASEDQVASYARNFTGTLGVIANSSYATYANENFPAAQVREFPSWDEAVAALSQGEILAVYRDELEIRRVLANTPNSGLVFKPLYFSDMTDPIAIAVHSDNSQLLFWLNIFLGMQGEFDSNEVISKYSSK